eukprot:SAG11_NODE_19167_length_472_cov_5.576408_1_plen_56_part_10
MQVAATEIFFEKANVTGLEQKWKDKCSSMQKTSDSKPRSSEVVPYLGGEFAKLWTD